MKLATFSILTAVALAALSGCAHHRRPWASQGDTSCVEATEGGEACPEECPAPCEDGPRCRGLKHHCPICAGHRQRRAPEQEAGPAGPPTGAVAYPYYTIRGPRDFLARNPASIGP